MADRQALRPGGKSLDEVARWFEAAIPSPKTAGGKASSVEQARVQDACRRPEIAPLLPGIIILVEPCSAPFELVDRDTIVLSTTAVSSHASAAWTLRYALEAATLDRVDPEPSAARKVAHTVLAAYLAVTYHDMMPGFDRVAIQAALSGPLASLLAGASAGGGIELHDIARVLADEHEVTFSAETHDEGVRIASRVWALARPAEYLLTTGGDDRLQVEPVTMLNKYGCSPKPRPEAITYSSSTASSVSEIAYNAAEDVRQCLLGKALTGDLSDATLALAECLRGRLATLLGLHGLPGAEILLTSSGTDAELCALHFALEGTSTGVINVVVGPDEIGSGTVTAAAGRHFAEHTPLGGRTGVGLSIEGFPSERVEVACVQIRSSDGSVLNEADLHSQIIPILAYAEERHWSVLLHVLDSSKTNLSAPSSDTVRLLRRDSRVPVQVVVDAAQMRLSAAAVRRYLAEEFMVVITGSKFYTGPPFAGSLLVPPGIARLVDAMDRLPAGLSDYCARSDFPPRWRRLAAGLAHAHNLGLLLRWEAALSEMDAFHAVPATGRRRILEAFGQAVLQAADENPHVEMVAAPAVDRGNGDEDPERWDSLPTIFSFLVLEGADRRPLDVREARLVYEWLNEDITARLPAATTSEERVIAATKCHIGQPVPFAGGGDEVLGALRLSAGARLVSGVQFDRRLGETEEDRLAKEVQDAIGVLAKIALIARNWGTAGLRLTT